MHSTCYDEVADGADMLKCDQCGERAVVHAVQPGGTDAHYCADHAPQIPYSERIAKELRDYWRKMKAAGLVASPNIDKPCGVCSKPAVVAVSSGRASQVSVSYFCKACAEQAGLVPRAEEQTKIEDILKWFRKGHDDH
jgi:hypothetical protein